jgi:putative hydrolase of the HAD superfamily
MSIDVRRVDAVTLDFYNTLVFHKQGSGRGAMLMEYLRSQDLESDPWEHQVLYDLFERHATDYAPGGTAAEKQRYLVWLTERLFQRLNVRAPSGAAVHHVEEVWRVLGPNSLGVFPEVPGVLRMLRRAGYPVSVISNWQCGLENFCRELGIADAVDHVVASAEIGIAKPDARIFRDVCGRMGISCDRVLHVGDSFVDDVEGGKSAGMQVMMILRDGELQYSNTPTIRSLKQLTEVLCSDSESRSTEKRRKMRVPTKASDR